MHFFVNAFYLTSQAKYESFLNLKKKYMPSNLKYIKKNR